MVRHILLLFTFTLALLTPHDVRAQNGVEPEQYAKINLISEKTTAIPGDVIFIAIEQNIHPGWHTYWINPGDSGEAMNVDWTLPEGFKISPLKWPVPHKIKVGPFISYGFEDKAIILQELSVPYDLPEGPLTLTAEIKVLVCEEICIPEFSTHSLTLNDGITISNEAYIDEALNALPFDAVGISKFYQEGEKFVLTAGMSDAVMLKALDARYMEIVPEEWGIVQNNVKAFFGIKDKKDFVLKQPVGERVLSELEHINGIILSKDKWGRPGAMNFEAVPDPVWLEQVRKQEEAEAAMQQQTAPFSLPQFTVPSVSLAMALVFALLGGIILNLMPCVFPVLSMKAISLCQMREKELSTARLHGISYTAGILVSFALIAGILIAIKAGGTQIGWGFQLQNPFIVLLLAWLLFVIGLNLSGFFSITANFANIGGRFLGQHGYSASFLTGVLATLVATPCTAPFMGVAMGFAFTQPASIAMVIFLTLGMGLALPYLLLSFFPALQVILPKPGRWMETFKKIMAVPMYISALWLVWVYGQQVGSGGILLALAGITALILAIWFLKIASGKENKKVLFYLLAAALVTLPLYFGAMKNTKERSLPIFVEKNTYAEPYTHERFTTLEAGNDPIFIDMTADWCITCKFNEKIALNIPEVKALFKEKKVHYLKGDWTNSNPEITEFLNRHGRGGVPLYIYYGERKPDTKQRPDPVILPQLLTPGIIVKTVDGS